MGSEGGHARAEKLSAEARKDIASRAAKARWADKKVNLLATTVSRKSPSKKRRPVKQSGLHSGKAFNKALQAAEQRYAEATQEYAVVSAQLTLLQFEIPALQRTIQVLRQQQNPTGGAGVMPYVQPFSPQIPSIPQPPTMEQILADAPLQAGYQPPPFQTAPQPVAIAPPPASVVPRVAGGGAMGIELPATGEDDDQHLRDSGVAGGQWI